MKAYRGSIGTAPLILNLVTRRRRVANSSTGHITPGKEPRYLNMKLSGPQNRSERCEKEKSLLHLLGFKLWTIQPTAQLLYRLCYSSSVTFYTTHKI